MIKLMIIYVGYTQYAATPELIPLEAKKSLLYIFALLPGLFSFTSIMPMFFYKLTGKEHKRITKALEERRQKNLDELNQLHDKAN